jgi:2-methylcitrate dehydratase
MSTGIEAIPYDPLLIDIADYVDSYAIQSDHAFEIARYCLIDSMACALDALEHPVCMRLIGPVVPDDGMANGARVPGTNYQLDPVTAAFNIGAMVRWTDFSDTFVAGQTTHPSDDVGAILAVTDYVSRTRMADGKPPLTLHTVLDAMIKAHEIQGVLGMGQGLNPYGIDHVFLVKIACAAVAAKLLGGTRTQIMAATSLAFFDPPLCVHRFGSNTGPRKSWAAAECAGNAVRLALMAVKGEPGYPQVLSHPKWGLCKTRLGGDDFKRGCEFQSMVMENVIFKIMGPVVIHAQSSIECALALSSSVRERLDDIATITLFTHKRTLETIDKTGPLRNPADRDHCLQYAIAVSLLRGKLTAADYEDEVAADPRIDQLRALMTVTENPVYTARYTDGVLRANPNGIEITFKDGASTGLVERDNPVGHPSRRAEGIPLLINKLSERLGAHYSTAQQTKVLALCLDHAKFVAMPVPAFTDLFALE